MKIGDFGLAIRTGSEKTASLTLKCGTPVYMAPEMNNQNSSYTNSVDVWSVGVIMYRLMCKGEFPFGIEELRQLAIDQDISIDGKFKKIDCSFNCMHLLRGLLAVDPYRRFPPYIAIDHPFILGDRNSAPNLMYFEYETTQETKRKMKMVVIMLSGL